MKKKSTARKKKIQLLLPLSSPVLKTLKVKEREKVVNLLAHLFLETLQKEEAVDETD